MNLKDYISEAVSHGRKHSYLFPECSIDDTDRYLENTGLENYKDKTFKSFIPPCFKDMKPRYERLDFSTSGDTNFWICLPKINRVYKIQYIDGVMDCIGVYVVVNYRESEIEEVGIEDRTGFVRTLESIEKDIYKELKK